MQQNKNNAQTVRQLSLLGMDLCNRIKEVLAVEGMSDEPVDWAANARRQFERLLGTALRVEKENE